MNKRGPIVVIEDDLDDQQLLKQVFAELKYPNEIVLCTDGEEALEYLRLPEVRPFIILSDINMPRLNGFELRMMVQTELALASKCIPYLFFSTSVESNAVTKAYSMSAQGIFKKPANYAELVSTIKLMVDYWKVCYSPSNYAANSG